MSVETLPYPAEDLLRKSVHGIHSRHKRYCPGHRATTLRAVIGDYFGCGSTSAAQICTWAGLNPDEEVNRSPRVGR